MAIKAWLKKNALYLGASLILLLYLSPNVFIGESAILMEHDNLNSNVVLYKFLAESDLIFASNDAVIPNIIGGIPRGCYPSEFGFILWLFVLFSPVVAYHLNVILMHVIAFIGMNLLLRRHVVPKANELLIVAASLSFAMLPFWPFGGLTIAGQPLLLFVLLNILREKAKLQDWIIVTLFPFYSDLSFGNMFFAIAISLFFAGYSIHKKRFNLKFVLAMALFTMCSVIVEHRLLELQYLEGFESQRLDYTKAKSALLNINGVLGVSLSHFLKGQYHFYSHQFPIIAPIAIIGLILIKSITVKLRLGALLLTCALISLGKIVLEWDKLYELKESIQILNILNLRFESLFPMLWCIILAYSLAHVSKITWMKYVVPVVLVMQLGSITFTSPGDYQGAHTLENAFFRTYVNEGEHGFISMKDYYADDFFTQLKESLPEGDYKVGCLGFQPARASYNGFHTIGGYHYYFPLENKQEFKQVIIKELEKVPKSLAKFENFGAVCNLFSEELWNNPSAEELNSLQLNTKKMKELGCNYLFSTALINNSKELNIDLEAEFTNVDGKMELDKIYVYALK